MIAVDRHRIHPSGLVSPSMIPHAVREAASAASKLPGMGETTSLIAQKLVAHAAPLVQNDHELQKRVGAAIGEGMGRQIAAPVYIAAAAVTGAAAFAVWKMLG